MKIDWRKWFLTDHLPDPGKWLLAFQRLPYVNKWLSLRPLRCTCVVESADEIPQTLARGAAVVVSSGGRHKWVAFDCPCRSGHRILLNLDQSRRPAWGISVKHDGLLSLSPSVNYHDDHRRCHYFVRDGKVIWLGDTYP